jgi:transcriptional regulator with GAF, ATPase, and Fis domain
MNFDPNLALTMNGKTPGSKSPMRSRGRDPKIEWLSLAQLEMGSETMAQMVARSEQLRTVFRAVERLRPYRSPVLVMGETGTGKELVGRALHSQGPSPKGPFVVFNCCNLVEALAESQLFGHVRGAFTDAGEESQGYFRAANGGTLLLDEIGDLPPSLQGKLLRVVESYEVQPIGSAQRHRIDLRLVAATNRDLGAMVSAGKFRADLYYRLNATSIFLAPLRERRADIEVLLGHFVKHYNSVFGKKVEYVSSRVLTLLTQYSWPGNVRELAHAVEIAVLLTGDECVDVEDLAGGLMKGTISGRPAEPVRPVIEDNHIAASYELTLAGAAPSEASTLKAVVTDALVRALQKTGGNRRRAAQTLGVSRSTFYRMMARYGVPLSSRDPSSPNKPAEQIGQTLP